jgi:hypothetical protein
VGKAEYLIDREWLVACMAKEFLPARLKISQFKKLPEALQYGAALSILETHRVGGGALPRLSKSLIKATKPAK